MSRQEGRDRNESRPLRGIQVIEMIQVRRGRHAGRRRQGVRVGRPRRDTAAGTITSGCAAPILSPSRPGFPYVRRSGFVGSMSGPLHVREV